MKILYRQPEDDINSSLSRYGLNNCYFKKLSVERDRLSITKKAHLHKGFEMHIITEGSQEYEIDGKRYCIKAGSFLLVYPNVLHTVIDSSPNALKYSITFNKQTTDLQNCYLGNISSRMADNINFISNEAIETNDTSAMLIENSILEILVGAFRLSGVKESGGVKTYEENATVLMAKQYINDNIEMAPTVFDVAKYCYLSTKQLTRIFHKSEGVTPGEYIINCRTEKIVKLLADESFSLKQISEKMHFNNEYYFNAFLKKRLGMPPGEYRKMLGQ